MLATFRVVGSHEPQEEAGKSWLAFMTLQVDPLSRHAMQVI